MPAMFAFYHSHEALAVCFRQFPGYFDTLQMRRQALRFFDAAEQQAEFTIAQESGNTTLSDGKALNQEVLFPVFRSPQPAFAPA